MYNNVIAKNKLYLGSILALTALLVMLNFCKAIYQCSMVFVVTGLVMNMIASKWNKQYALNGLFGATLLGLAISYQDSYYLNGTLISLLALGSLVSVVISMLVSLNLFVSLKEKMSFTMASFLSISVAAVIDGIAMSSFFVLKTNFALNKIADMGIREISWKLLYVAVFSILLSTIVRFVNNQRLQVIR